MYGQSSFIHHLYKYEVKLTFGYEEGEMCYKAEGGHKRRVSRSWLSGCGSPVYLPGSGVAGPPGLGSGLIGRASTRAGAAGTSAGHCGAQSPLVMFLSYHFNTA